MHFNRRTLNLVNMTESHWNYFRCA